MGAGQVQKIQKENELYRKVVVFCVLCRGKYKYQAMPGTTTCLKHRQPSRRTLIRKLIEISN